VVKLSILERLVNRIIKGDGKTNKSTISVREEKEIKLMISRSLESLREGKSTKIYLPLTTSLEGLGGLSVIISEEPSETINNFRQLIYDVVQWTYPIIQYNESTMKAISRCLEEAEILYREDKEKGKGLAFVNKYLYLNKDFVKNAIELLIQEYKYSGSIAILKSLIVSDSYTDLYKRCGKIQVGKSKSDVLNKRFHTVARFYDNLLILMGAAIHEPRSPEELIRGRGRKSYTLFVSPFAPSLRFIITHHDVPQIEDYLNYYVDAYTGFVGIVANDFFNRELFGRTIAKVDEYLNMFKRKIPITVSPDDTSLQRSVSVLLKLLKNVLSQT